jgi:hypothetical protein
MKECQLSVKTIRKYEKYTLPQLRIKAGVVFRKWIRKRDTEQPCISCGTWDTSDAGHFYSAGHYPELEFHPDNVHVQCKKCNMHLHGNLIEYRKKLIVRIGEQSVEKLDEIAAYYKRITYKHDRFVLIDIIEQYKGK